MTDQMQTIAMLFAAAAAGYVGAFIRHKTAKATFKSVRAEKFELISPEGGTHGILTLLDGEPTLGLMDKPGDIRMMINTTSVSLHDEASELRVILGSVSDDDVGLRLFDSDGVHRTTLNVSENGAGIQLRDEAGEIRTMLSVIGDDASLEAYDSDGNVITYVGADGNTPKMVMYGQDQQALAAIYGGEDGPVFAMSDPNGQVVTHMAVGSGGPILAMRDSAGNIRAFLEVKDYEPLLLLNHSVTGYWTAPNTLREEES